MQLPLHSLTFTTKVKEGATNRVVLKKSVRREKIKCNTLTSS